MKWDLKFRKKSLDFAERTFQINMGGVSANDLQKNRSHKLNIKISKIKNIADDCA